MNLRVLRRSLGVGIIVVAGVHTGSGAEQTRATTPAGKAQPISPAQQRPASTRSGTAKGPLPDPALLDGSTHPVEKKSEQGMIGDFELPGDENVRSGKVGGPQNPTAGAAGGQSASMPSGLPQAGGGQQGQPQSGGQQGAPSAQGAQTAGGQQAGGPQGGAQAGGPQNPNAAGNPIAGAGEQGGQAQGIQVAELGGEASGQSAAGGVGEKPPPVAIGDSAMRIPASQGAAGVVGGQQQQVAGQTQHHEKGTGTGGKGAGGAGSGNRVEKGRTIPAGL